jgi:hypothetical protein
VCIPLWIIGDHHAKTVQLTVCALWTHSGHAWVNGWIHGNPRSRCGFGLSYGSEICEFATTGDPQAARAACCRELPVVVARGWTHWPKPHRNNERMWTHQWRCQEILIHWPKPHLRRAVTWIHLWIHCCAKYKPSGRIHRAKPHRSMEFMWIHKEQTGA